jgi:hypothetical protein
MKLACNIDQRGRKARLISGAIAGVAGIVAVFFGWIVAGVALLIAGGFMIFEGAKGWCALRALGFKTRL